jgi:hypothetical protein
MYDLPQSALEHGFSLFHFIFSLLLFDFPQVPPLAVVRLETALLDLLDSTGGAVAVNDLATFWGFLAQGSSMEDAAKHALALLPDDPAASAYDALGQAKNQLMLLDQDDITGGSASKETAAAAGGAPMSERTAARAGMAGAVMKLGGSVPPSVKALVRQARRASGEVSVNQARYRM